MAIGTIIMDYLTMAVHQAENHQGEFTDVMLAVAIVLELLGVLARPTRSQIQRTER